MEFNEKTPRPHSEIPFGYLKELRGLADSTPPGNFAELGVYKGGSAWAINTALKEGFELHLFDTFQGIHFKDGDGDICAGRFKDTSPEEVKGAIPNAVIHVGVFPDTFEAVKDKNFSFVHVDCDVYSACKAALDLFWPKLPKGGIMAFDDYPFEGIKKALHEFKGAKLLFTPVGIPYFIKGEE